MSSEPFSPPFFYFCEPFPSFTWVCHTDTELTLRAFSNLWADRCALDISPAPARISKKDFLQDGTTFFSPLGYVKMNQSDDIHLVRSISFIFDHPIPKRSGKIRPKRTLIQAYLRGEGGNYVIHTLIQPDLGAVYGTIAEDFVRIAEFWQALRDFLPYIFGRSLDDQISFFNEEGYPKRHLARLLYEQNLKKNVDAGFSYVKRVTK